VKIGEIGNVLDDSAEACTSSRRTWRIGEQIKEKTCPHLPGVSGHVGAMKQVVPYVICFLAARTA